MNLERTKYMREIRRKMVEYFDLDELQTLSFDLGIDWDELPGDKKSTKSQSLIRHLAQRGGVKDLIDLLQEERPHGNWPPIPDATQQILDEQSTNPNLIKLDQVLFLKIRDILPSDGSILHVRVHDYGGSFALESHSDLHEFIWQSARPEFEFFDQELEKLRQNLVSNIEEFLQIIAKETFPVSGAPERNRLPRLYDFETRRSLGHQARDQKHYKQLEEEYGQYLIRIREKLNSLGDEINENYDEFIRLGRRKLGV